MGSEKLNPSTSELGGMDVLGSVDESCNATSLPVRVARFGNAKARAVEMMSHLQVVIKSGLDYPHYHKAHANLRHCGNWLLFRDYYTANNGQGDVRLHAAHFCKQHLLCPLCAIRRGSKSVQAYLERWRVIQAEQPDLRAYMLTLTVRNGADLAERFEHLQSGVKRLLERRRDWFKKRRGATQFRHVHGLIGTYEVTYSDKGGGWHPHCHMIALCRDGQVPDFPMGADISDQDKRASGLSSEWHAITGDSWIVDLRPLAVDDEQQQVKSFCEVFKYALKFSCLTPSKTFEAWEYFRGRRLLFSVGAFRGVQVPESLTDTQLEDLPYLEYLYKYLPKARGYSLARVPQTVTLPN